MTRGDVMENNNNVKIPMALFQETLDFLQRLQPIPLTQDVWLLYKNVYREFQRKQFSMELRDTYAAVVNAKTELERDKARTRYLAEKSYAQELLRNFE
jgi:hypothetical protein